MRAYDNIRQSLTAVELDHDEALKEVSELVRDNARLTLQLETAKERIAELESTLAHPSLVRE